MSYNNSKGYHAVMICISVYDQNEHGDDHMTFKGLVSFSRERLFSHKYKSFNLWTKKMFLFSSNLPNLFFFNTTGSD